MIYMDICIIYNRELKVSGFASSEIPQKGQRLDRYKEIIQSLPRVNRTTLAAVIGHLYR